MQQEEVTAPDAPQDGEPESSATEQQAEEQKPVPPWGTDEEFNPEKAWKLIQNLRGDLEKVKPAVTKLRELEDAQKSELEKAQELSAATAQERDAAKAEALRLRTAIKHGISDEDAELFLTGTDEETLTRQAERLAERIAAAGPKVPKPDPLQGARGPLGMDARIAEAEKSGDVKASIALKSQQLLKK